MNPKINLQGEVRSGYWNISNNPQFLLEIKDPPDHTEFSVGQYNKLGSLVPDNFAEELLFSPPINLLSPQEIPHCLVEWHQKLKVGGVFKCHLIDIKRVGKAAYNGLGLQELSDLIFGKQNERKSVIEGQILQKVLESLGFRIESVSIQGFITVIEASKNA